MSIHDKSLHKCNGSCNAVDESFLEIFLSSEKTSMLKYLV